MAEKIENCCVGNISLVNDDCHQLIHTNKVCITLISDLQNTDQRVIKLRVQSENIKTICAQYYYVFFLFIMETRKVKRSVVIRFLNTGKRLAREGLLYVLISVTPCLRPQEIFVLSLEKNYVRDVSKRRKIF